MLIQFHHNLPLPSSWLQALLPASQLPGSYHQSLADTETLQGLNCFTERKVLVGQQQPCLLAMEEHWVELLVDLTSSQNTNFKFWPSDGDGPKSSVKVKRTMEDGMWQSRDNEKNCEPYFFGFASSLWVYWICTNLIVGELNNWINWLLSFTKTQQHLHSCRKLRCDRSFQKFLQLIKNTTAQLQLLHNLHLTSV